MENKEGFVMTVMGFVILVLTAIICFELNDPEFQHCDITIITKANDTLFFDDAYLEFEGTLDRLGDIKDELLIIDCGSPPDLIEHRVKERDIIYMLIEYNPKELTNE